MNIAIVLAGGTGSRMSLDKPKQFALVKGKPLMVYTLSVFNNCSLVDEIYFVSNKDYLKESKSIIEKHHLNKVKDIIVGGSTRQESVFNALERINANENDIVLIHDCARPLVDEHIIKDNIEQCQLHDAVETAVKAVDTTIEVNEEQFENSLNRDKLYQVQTPQTFRYKLIKDAHENAIKNKQVNITDDAQLVAKLGHKVFIVNGKKTNLKVTTDEDLKILKALL